MLKNIKFSLVSFAIIALALLTGVESAIGQQEDVV